MSLPLPPGVPGLPLLGNLIEFQKRPMDLLQRGYETLGPIFSIQLGPKRVAVLIGSENNKFFFSATDKLLSIREIYRWMIPIFGEDYNLSAPREKYLVQRRMSMPLYSPERMRQVYIPAMVRETRDWLSSLGCKGHFDVISSFGLLTMQIASRALVGNAFREQLGAQFREHFQDLAAGVTFLLPPKLPLPRFLRRDRAKKQLHSMIHDFIRKRRSAGYVYDDNLQFLLEAKDANGNSIPEEKIPDVILALVFAGHETTQSQLSWSLIQLLQNPAYLQLVLEECDEVFQDGPDVGPETLRRMVRIDRAVMETERMRPITSMMMRVNSQSYEHGGYRIPQDWITLISPVISHRLPQEFSQPDRYDPDRFSDERDPRRKAANALIGFGGGSHKCPGMEFAYTNMKIILTMLLQKFDLELVNPDPQPAPGIVAHPRQPCLVRYRQRVPLKDYSFAETCPV